MRKEKHVLQIKNATSKKELLREKRGGTMAAVYGREKSGQRFGKEANAVQKERKARCFGRRKE